MALASACAVLLVGGCGGDDSGNGSKSVALPKGSEPVELDPADFTTKIDNPYWPMAPRGRRGGSALRRTSASSSR